MDELERGTRAIRTSRADIETARAVTLAAVARAVRDRLTLVAQLKVLKQQVVNQLQAELVDLQNVAAASELYGISSRDAEALLKFRATNPELLEKAFEAAAEPFVQPGARAQRDVFRVALDADDDGMSKHYGQIVLGALAWLKSNFSETMKEMGIPELAEEDKAKGRPKEEDHKNNGARAEATTST